MMTSDNEVYFFIVNILERLALSKDNSFVLWNISTSIETIVRNFISNIKITLSVSQKNLYNIISVDCSNSNYALYLGKIPVTPVNDKNYYRKESTMRQYLQVLFGCGLIRISDKELSNEWFNNQYCLSNIAIWNKSEEDILTFYKKKLLLTVFEDNREAEKLFYSLIITYLYSVSKFKEVIDINNIEIRSAKSNEEKLNEEKIISARDKTLYSNFYDAIEYFFNGNIDALYSYLKLLIFTKTSS